MARPPAVGDPKQKSYRRVLIILTWLKTGLSEGTKQQINVQFLVGCISLWVPFSFGRVWSPIIVTWNRLGTNYIDILCGLVRSPSGASLSTFGKKNRSGFNPETLFLKAGTMSQRPEVPISSGPLQPSFRDIDFQATILFPDKFGSSADDVFQWLKQCVVSPDGTPQWVAPHQLLLDFQIRTDWFDWLFQKGSWSDAAPLQGGWFGSEFWFCTGESIFCCLCQSDCESRRGLHYDCAASTCWRFISLLAALSFSFHWSETHLWNRSGVGSSLTDSQCESVSQFPRRGHKALTLSVRTLPASLRQRWTCGGRWNVTRVLITAQVICVLCWLYLSFNINKWSYILILCKLKIVQKIFEL